MRYSLVLALFAAGLAQAADKLVGGPYVVRPTDRSATIGWVIESDTVATGAAAGQVDRRVPVLRCEKVSMTGQKAGETVYYEIPASAGGTTEMRQGHFKTPPTGRATFQFVVFGDTRTRHELHRKVVDAIAKTDPDFVLHTGDLVTDGYDTAQWPVFFDIEREMLRKTVFFPVLGNHERDNARFHEFFDVKSPYYSFNWGSAHFALLDSDLTNYSVSVRRARAVLGRTDTLAGRRSRGKSEGRFPFRGHAPPAFHGQSKERRSREQGSGGAGSVA